MTAVWNSKGATIGLLVLCTSALLFGLGGFCDTTKITVTQQMADESNRTLQPGEHRLQPGRYERRASSGDVGIHYLNSKQAGRYADHPDSGNYVGTWVTGAGGFGPQRFCPGERVGDVPQQGNNPRGAGNRTLPGGRGSHPSGRCRGHSN